MTKTQNQTGCGCEKTSCGCVGMVAEPCTCGEQCACASGCGCGSDCGC